MAEMVRSHPIVLLVALCLVSPESMRAQERATPPRERHPCVLCGTEEAELLRERCSREPYATWRRSIEATAREALAAAPDDLGDTYRRASRAKALAFLAWIEPVDRTARVERAILCLSRLDAPLEKGRFTGNYVHFPNACSDASEAYDFLCAVVGTTDPRLAPIRARLVEFAGALHDSDPGWYAWHWNNWQIRQFSCLGSFAIVLADDPAAAKWARTAENAVRKCYDYQACGDGAWAEGHSYFAYSAEHFLPYFFALRRAGGRDFFVEPMVRETHEWSVKSRLPDGRRPNFDDSHIARYPSHWLTGAWKDSVFRWDRESSDEPTWPGFSPVDAICFYDDTVAAAPPSWNPTQFLVEGGDIIFRSGWDRDAIYMNLRAEHGDPRTHGGGHEHPDETSFLLYSGSTPLCIDSGYINYAEHAKVYNA
ncbi:MAG: heparinase II/III family protein, partial [Planctomycetes bacterium]|nr:heparinase II/III family protein [Planctomycetota bacterium]